MRCLPHEKVAYCPPRQCWVSRPPSESGEEGAGAWALLAAQAWAGEQVSMASLEVSLPLTKILLFGPEEYPGHLFDWYTMIMLTKTYIL